MKTKEEMLSDVRGFVDSIQKRFEQPLFVEISEPHLDDGIWMIDIGLSKDSVTVNVIRQVNRPIGVSDIGTMEAAEAFGFAPEHTFEEEEPAIDKIVEILQKEAK